MKNYDDTPPIDGSSVDHRLRSATESEFDRRYSNKLAAPFRELTEEEIERGRVYLISMRVNPDTIEPQRLREIVAVLWKGIEIWEQSNAAVTWFTEAYNITPKVLPLHKRSHDNARRKAFRETFSAAWSDGGGNLRRSMEALQKSETMKRATEEIERVSAQMDGYFRQELQRFMEANLEVARTHYLMEYPNRTVMAGEQTTYFRRYALLPETAEHLKSVDFDRLPADTLRLESGFTVKDG